ncbi:MAG TPA: translation elongation factor Ts [Anaerolineales bacterium]|nr:translation elongation factor Ts [Anaerolineales bacterium]HRF49514.1 translation elongation factor Ts [Anaerolineales bacterium]
MAEITAQMVKQLREATQAGMLECRKALVESNGDFDKAVTYLREKGLAAAAKKSGREAREGKVELYSHAGGRIGVMVEVNCETDFVARTEQFQLFAHDLALHIAASSPKYMDVADVPAEVLEAERSVARNRALQEGKPEKVVDKIVEGRIEKFYQDVCLMRQAYVRDDSLTVADLLKQTIATIGENVIIRRYVRWELGEEISA